jgi:hypothetical protein
MVFSLIREKATGNVRAQSHDVVLIRFNRSYNLSCHLMVLCLLQIKGLCDANDHSPDIHQLCSFLRAFSRVSFSSGKVTGKVRAIRSWSKAASRRP